MTTRPLSACPFCGDSDIVLDTSGEACRYQCNECGAITDSWFKGPSATDAAAAAWNRRAPAVASVAEHVRSFVSRLRSRGFVVTATTLKTGEQP